MFLAQRCVVMLFRSGSAECGDAVSLAEPVYLGATSHPAPNQYPPHSQPMPTAERRAREGHPRAARGRDGHGGARGDARGLRLHRLLPPGARLPRSLSSRPAPRLPGSSIAAGLPPYTHWPRLPDANALCKHPLLPPLPPMPLRRRSRCLCGTSPWLSPQPAASTRECGAGWCAKRPDGSPSRLRPTRHHLQLTLQLL